MHVLLFHCSHWGGWHLELWVFHGWRFAPGDIVPVLECPTTIAPPPPPRIAKEGSAGGVVPSRPVPSVVTEEQRAHKGAALP